MEQATRGLLALGIQVRVGNSLLSLSVVGARPACLAAHLQ